MAGLTWSLRKTSSHVPKSIPPRHSRHLFSHRSAPFGRIIFDWSAMLGSWSVPMWLSWVALIVTGALAYFGFSLATQSSRKGSFS